MRRGQRKLGRRGAGREKCRREKKNRKNPACHAGYRIVSFLQFFGRIPVDSSHFPLYFVCSLSPKYYILKVLMCSFNKRNCIVDKTLKIIKLIKNAVSLILDNFGIVGFLVFGRMPVDSSHFSPHFGRILSSKYSILKALKRCFDPNIRTNWRPTGECVAC